ncbi:hypothetical protein ACFQ0T_00945 [Kitasatospora gansuensis]
MVALTAAEPRRRSAWLGLLGVAGAVLALAQLSFLPALLSAYFGPAAQWGSTWFGLDDAHRDWQLTPAPFALPWLLVAVLGAAAARCARTGHRARARQLLGAALAVGGPLAVLLPALLHLPLRTGAVWAVLLVVGATAALVRRPAEPAAALALLAPTTVAAVLWSGADRPTTIAVWSVLAVLAALLAASLPRGPRCPPSSACSRSRWSPSPPGQRPGSPRTSTPSPSSRSPRCPSRSPPGGAVRSVSRSSSRGTRSHRSRCC